MGIAMRLRMPPFLPPYVVLFLVFAYAVTSLWLGLARLDAISRTTESTTRSAATLHDLRALQNAVRDIEAAEGLVGSPAPASLVDAFERGRRHIPILLSALRDKMRDDAVELGLIDELVPLIAGTTMLAASNLERRRAAPEPPSEVFVGEPGKGTSGQLGAIIATLEAREQDELEQDRRARLRNVERARRDLYLMAAVTLILIVSLFLAVRRLRLFIPVLQRAPGELPAAATADQSPDASDTGVETLLRDAMLRARMAVAQTPSESSRRLHRQALLEAIEQALRDRAGAFDDDAAPSDAKDLDRTMALLAQTYSVPGGITVKATIDRSAATRDPHRAFLVFRAAEWALEAITVRKRVGSVALELTAAADRIFLRVHALTDDPELPVALTPKEREEVDVLRHSVTTLGGTFLLGEAPTGFSLTLALPVDA